MKTIAILTVCLVLSAMSFAADKNIVLIAGRPSHGPGEHEHNAGVLLFKKCLTGVPGINVTTHLNGEWPDEAELNGASTIIVYCDGGGGHLALQNGRLAQLDALMKKGIGFGCVHYGCEPTTDKGNKEFRDWIGGCFETFWSVNPHWEANFKTLPNHPVTTGVKGFQMRDEWYFHMRFRDGMKDVTPILSAVPPIETMNRYHPGDKPSTHGGNPAVYEAVKNGEPQHVMWVAEREGGGRGFGFTGGHFHKNWGNEDFRKVVLNAIVWTAHASVPEGGVAASLTEDDLKANLDPKGPRTPKK